MNTSSPWLSDLQKQVRLGLQALYREPPLTAVEWADKHFYLSSESSYQEGKWVTAPFQVAILNAMGNDLIREVNVIKSARVGYTKMLMANIGYKLQHKKRNVLSYCPTEPDAEELMKRHVEPFIRDVPVLLALAPWYGKKHRDSSLTAKRFANQKMLWCLGGKASRNYREKSPDEVIYDELSKFDADIEGEGSPTFLGDKRLEGATFKKSIRGSTPGTAGECQVTKAGEESPYFLRFHIPCPCCGKEQFLKWGGKDCNYGIKYEKNALGEAERAWYVCEHSGCEVQYHEMVEAANDGRWICERTGLWSRDSMEWFKPDGEHSRAPRSVTFHIWTAYSTFTTWLDMASDWLKVKGDREKLITFINTTLGEVWEGDEGEKLEWEHLFARRELWQWLPGRVVALTGFIDTQDDRYEARVWAWAAGEEAWLVDRWILTGDPASEELRRKVGLRLHQQYTREDGVVMRVALWGWDSGGHYTDEVYAESKKHGLHWVIPTKGHNIYGKPVAEFPRNKNKAGVYLTMIGTDNAKELIYSRLKLQPQPGAVLPGVMHLPANDLICDETELKQLTAETKVRKFEKGKWVSRWDAKGRRNEALDCVVGALAMLRVAQQSFGLLLDAPTQESAPPPPPPPRRSTRSGYLKQRR
ncbi:Phage terminase large subunit [compost metagenome]